MGEIAEMMVNGCLCEGCGAYIDGQEPGYPRYCSRACAQDRGAVAAPKPKLKRPHPRRGPYKHRRRGRAHG